MKSVIMIAYLFPPEGAAGAHRPLRFVRHLPLMGWRPVVISSADPYERYDPSLLSLVPPDTEVIRVSGYDPWQAFQDMRRRRMQVKLSKNRDGLQDSPLRSFVRQTVRHIEACCYHPDMAMPWINPATKATVDMCRRVNPSVIWATAGPVSSFAVAQRASRLAGVPYVLDFRDPWTLTYNEFEAKRPGWAVRSDRRNMYQALKGARAAVFLHDTVAECYWHAYRGALDASRIHIIPNGYEGQVAEFAQGPTDARCTILYAGTVSGCRYHTLLQSLKQFHQSAPDKAGQLRLLFVGECTDELAVQVAQMGLSNIVETKGTVSQAEIISLQEKAHALLVLGQDRTMKGYELFAASKVFACLKSGRPIVGVLPKNETRKILLRVGVSTVANVDSPLEIVAVLRRVIDAWSEGTLSSLVPNRAACEVYSAERQTAALVRALEGSFAVNPFIPGSVEVAPSLRAEIANRSKATGRYQRDELAPSP